MCSQLVSRPEWITGGNDWIMWPRHVIRQLTNLQGPRKFPSIRLCKLRSDLTHNWIRAVSKVWDAAHTIFLRNTGVLWVKYLRFTFVWAFHLSSWQVELQLCLVSWPWSFVIIIWRVYISHCLQIVSLFTVCMRSWFPCWSYYIVGFAAWLSWLADPTVYS